MRKTTARPRPVHPDEVRALVAASDQLRDSLGVAVSAAQLGELDQPERKRLLELTRRLRSEPMPGQAQAPSLDERAAAEAFAAAVEKLPATASPRLRREQELTVALTRRTGFIPSPSERLVLRGAEPDATLDALRERLAAAAPGWRGPRRINWRALESGEAGELEGLVETALGSPGFFKRRRSEAGSRTRLDFLARRAAAGAPRRSPLPEGWATLPVGLLDDLLLGALEPADLAVYAAFALTLHARQAHPAREERGDVRFEGDSVVVGARGMHLFVDWDPSAREVYDRYLESRVAPSLERLGRAGWLDVEPAERDALRVSLGARSLPR